MGFIWGRKAPSGRIDYYYRVTKRVNGRPRVVINIYIGRAEKILNAVRGRAITGDFELLSFQFGTTAAIMDVNEETGFTDIVRGETGSAATATALLSFICGRAEEPLSKNAMEGWSDRSAIRLMARLPSLSCSSYLRHMDRLTPANVSAISFRIAQKLIEKGHDPSLVFFDTTNFSTEQQPHSDEDRLLARPGHAKDHNSQAKLISLATATTDRYLPVIHNVFPGNTNGAAYFRNAVDSMIDTMKRLGVKCDDLCFVFDKGMNSEDGFGAMTGAGVHFVSSLKRNQVGELLKRAPGDYSGTYRTQSGEEILTFRSEKTVMGVDGVVVMTYNASAERRQRIDYNSAKKRFTEGCDEIASSLGTKHRGRPTTGESLHRRVNALIPEKWRTVFRYRIGSTIEDAAEGKGAVTLTHWIDGKAEKEKTDGFGRTAIFTDRKEWSNEKIAKTYLARSSMEEDYHVLKDTLLFPVMPIYHTLDRRIRAHAFMCVMGLLFYRYTQWKVEQATGERVPIGRLAAQLRRIRLGGLITNDGSGKKIRFRLERTGKEESALVKALNLERFIPD